MIDVRLSGGELVVIVDVDDVRDGVPNVVLKVSVKRRGR